MESKASASGPKRDVGARRLGAAAGAIALLGVIALGGRFLVGESRAELENPGRDTEPRVFTSARDQIRMVVPRQWHATDQATYPGIILWMMRNQPPAQVALTAEPFTRERYCSWPPQCRDSQEPLAMRFACALRSKLAAQRLRVEPTQLGPKENDAAGMPSAWFEYEDGKRFLRHAVALTADHAYSLVLSSPTAEARAAHTRTFEQMLRTLRPLTAAEAASAAAAARVDAAAGSAGSASAAAGSAAATDTAAPADASAPAADAGTPTADANAPATDAGAPAADAAAPATSAIAPATNATVSSPAPKILPVGPCP
jgi:hypothetical protein